MARRTTVQQLIERLQNHHNPEDTIVYQYFVSDFTDRTEEEFAPIAEYLMDNNSFGEEASNFFVSWITEAQDVLATVAEQEDN